jgi:rhodanese-related sulfurtransferase
MKKLLVCCATALAAVALYAGEYPDIKIPELKSAIAAGKVTLLDANGSESWHQGHIPGAIDFEANRRKLAKLLPKDKHVLVVAYCGGPMCQAYKAAAQAAEKLGYTNVRHLTAGISGWQEARLPMEKAD